LDSLGGHLMPVNFRLKMTLFPTKTPKNNNKKAIHKPLKGFMYGSYI
jgi:hypothetical protein